MTLLGKSNYERNFKVEFKGGQKGLDDIVALATSQRHGTFALGELKLQEPAAEVKVCIKPGFSSSYGSNAAYRLEALLVPFGNERLRANPSRFPGFRVNKIKDDYFLRSSELQSPIYLDQQALTAGLNYGMLLRSDVIFGNRLTPQEVNDAITAFARALELTVNSVYHSARKASPKLTLELAAGEEVKKIATKPAGQATLTKTQRPEDAAGTEDAVKVSLDALTSNVSFADIGGYQSVKDELTMFLLGIKNPEMAKRHGYSPAKGMLLYGPPGTGKTLFGKAIAGEAGAQFFYVDPTELLDKYVGESPKALRQVFENAATAAKESRKPSIVFIDEIDTFLVKRSSRGSGTDAVTSQLVNVFNQYMDGFKTEKIPNVYVVAATNRRDELDEAAVRPPRFVHVEVPLPDLEARTAIFQVTAKSLEEEAAAKLFNPEIDYNGLAMKTQGYSGADIANILREVRKSAFKEATDKKLGEIKLTSYKELETAVKAYRKTLGNEPMGFKTSH